VKEKILLDHERLAARIRFHREAGRRVVFTNGCFDLIHVGHVRLLQGAREAGDVLVVGVNDDEAVRKLKGPGRPFQPEAERAEIVASFRWVDLVTIFSGETADGILRKLRPDMHAKGTDYTPEQIPEADTDAAIGVRIAIVGDPKEHGTRDLIRRIRARGEEA
jgi:rfaE bifunctional protein nucleotidyltransferase chain/domain